MDDNSQSSPILLQFISNFIAEELAKDGLLNIMNKKKAILYLRFSDNKQKGGTSIEVQEKVVRASCDVEKFDVVDVIKDEAVSADSKKNKRTQRVAHLLEFCKERKGTFDVLVVYKTDRFARSQEQHHYLRGQLLKMKIILRSATEKIDESPSGKLVEGVLAAVNEYDNEIKRERVKLAMWARVEQGLWPWQPPTGYKKDENKPPDVKLVPHIIDDSCSEAVQDIFTIFSTGVVSKLDISKELKKRKLINSRGKTLAFSQQTIDNILKNIYFTGHLKTNEGKIIKGQHKSLIDFKLFQKCDDVMNNRSNNTATTRKRYHPDFPLRKFAHCGFCHKPLTAAWSNSEHSGKYPHYWCYNKECERARKTIRKADIEGDFGAYLATIKPSEDFIKRFDKVFIQRYKQREKDIRGDYLRQIESIKELETEKEWVIEQGKKSILKGDTLRDEVEKAERKLTLAKMELTEMHAEEMNIDALLAYAYDFIRTIENTWYEAPINYKVRLQRLVFPKGVEYKDGEFSNPEISPLFKLIEAFGDKKLNLVTPPGFEPGFSG